MSTHAHEWRPVEGYCALYACACSAIGHRRADGTIEIKAAANVRPEDLITARPTDDESIDNFGRRLPMVPNDWRLHWSSEYCRE